MKSNQEMLTDLGIDLTRIKESGKTKCPKCSHQAKHKNKTDLSVDVLSGVYQCWNDTCDFKGKVVDPADKKANGYEPKPKEYVRPKFHNQTELSDGLVKYFLGRLISQKTLKHFKVTEGPAWMPRMPEGKTSVQTIQFNYFRKGELINTKFRDSGKGFRMVKAAELIFYNYDACVDSDWCVIVEGEPDCLSYHEAGVLPVMSVPNGASNSDNPNLEYLDNCVEIFANKKKIILATDDDEAGRKLREELARRLGHERCYKVNYDGIKDANDYLKQKGPEALALTIANENLIEYPIAGIITANDIWQDVEFLLENGLSRGDITELLKEFDEHVSFQTGLLGVITGIPNHGKSPFALMIMVALSVNHGWKWGLFSPEHNPLSVFLVKICECLLGKRMRKESPATPKEMELAKSFIHDHFFFIVPEDDNVSVTNILVLAKSLVLRKGIRGLCIDPWNKLEHKMNHGEQETTYISRILDEVIKFNQKNSVLTLIIAHPMKMRKDVKTKLHEVPSLYDISGSANWFNKVDYGFCFYRNFKTNLSEIHIQKMKYDHLGKQGMVQVRYNVNNSRFTDQRGGWDNNNWLLPKVEQTNIDFSLPEVSIEPQTDWQDLSTADSDNFKTYGDLGRMEDDDLPF